jgi:hypothetical protein
MDFSRYDKSRRRILPGIDRPIRFASWLTKEMLLIGRLRPAGVQQVSTLTATLHTSHDLLMGNLRTSD